MRKVHHAQLWSKFHVFKTKGDDPQNNPRDREFVNETTAASGEKAVSNVYSRWVKEMNTTYSNPEALHFKRTLFALPVGVVEAQLRDRFNEEVATLNPTPIHQTFEAGRTH